MFKNKFILLKNYKNDTNQFTSFTSYELNNIKIFNEFIIKLLIILLLIANIYLFNQFQLTFDEFQNNNERNKKLTNHISIMGDYSLYKLYKYEQISLLISGINNWKINDASLLNFIDSLKQQTLKEIQIIFIFPDEKKNPRVNLIKKYIDDDKKMEIFFHSENKEEDNYFLF